VNVQQLVLTIKSVSHALARGEPRWNGAIEEGGIVVSCVPARLGEEKVVVEVVADADVEVAFAFGFEPMVVVELGFVGAGEAHIYGDN